MGLVLIERDRFGDLVRLHVDLHGQAEPVQFSHQTRVERRDRLRLQRQPAAAAVARLHDQLMVDEIEINLERAVAVWNRRGGEPARRHVQRDVPRMVQPRGLHAGGPCRRSASTCAAWRECPPTPPAAMAARQTAKAGLGISISARIRSWCRAAGACGSRARTCAIRACAYFSAYSRSIASRRRSPPARTARTRISRPATWIVPSGSSRNARYHPSAFCVHERANKRPFTTIGQTPVKRWSDRAPARTPMIEAASTAATIGRDRRFRAAIARPSPEARVRCMRALPTVPGTGCGK